MTVDLAALEQPLDPKHVRKPNGRYGPKGDWIEGWHAAAEANRIFGPMNWTREVREQTVVAEAEAKIGRDKADGWNVSYITRVRITVLDGGEGRPVFKEGTGAGHGQDRNLGLAHESAAKEAETDAMKRALSLFGWPFGLALYDKAREHVGESEPNRSRIGAEPEPTEAKPVDTAETLGAYTAEEALAAILRSVTLDELEDVGARIAKAGLKSDELRDAYVAQMKHVRSTQTEAAP